MEGVRGEFIKTVQEEYTNYCKARGEKETIQGYSEYLLNRNLVTDKTINRFVVISKYPTALDENLGIKKQAIYTIQDIVPLSFRSIRSILTNYQRAFRLKSRVVI